MKKFFIMLIILLEIFILNWCNQNTNPSMTSTDSTTNLETFDTETSNTTIYITTVDQTTINQTTENVTTSSLQTTLNTTTEFPTTNGTTTFLEFPDIMVTKTFASYTVLSLDIELDPNNENFVIYEVNLYENQSLIESKPYPELNVIYRDLEAATNYTLEVKVGNNCMADACEISYSETFKFETESLPPVTIYNLITTSNSVTFNILVSDNGKGEILEVSLLTFDEKELIASIEDLSNLTEISFTELDANTQYVIYVFYKNDEAMLGQTSEAKIYRYITTEN